MTSGGHAVLRPDAIFMDMEAVLAWREATELCMDVNPAPGGFCECHRAFDAAPSRWNQLSDRFGDGVSFFFMLGDGLRPEYDHADANE